MNTSVREATTGKSVTFPSAMGDPSASVVLTADQLQAIINNAVTAALQSAAEGGVIIKKKPATHKQGSSLYPYKSDGNPKPTAADPLRSPEDFQKMADYLLNHGHKNNRVRNYTLFVLGTTLGLRCGDLLRLTIQDVFSPEGKPLGHVTLIEEKTGKRNVNKITDSAYDALDLYSSTYPVDNPDAPLFCAQQHGNGPRRSMDITNVWRMLQQAADACGLKEHVSTHTMRKTYGYMAHAAAKANGTAGQTLETLQTKFKHADQRCTMIYAGIAQDDIDQMADSVNEILTK